MKAVSLEKLLPGDVPAGEHILWHGRPQAGALARRAYRGDFVAAYFAALAVWSVAYSGDAGWAAAALAGAKTVGLGAVALGLIAFLSYLSARTTLYVVTSRRVVLKIGVALPIFINIPFNEIASASVRTFSDGVGDIPLRLVSGRRIGYWILWPHARPLRFARPEPTLRGVGDAADVAETLSHALNVAAGQPQVAHPRDLPRTTRGAIAVPEHAPV
jgi:hypothetical protein